MRVFLALCASAAFGLAVAATGCEDGTYNPGAESGGSKGREYQINGVQGDPVSGSASEQAQSTGAPGAMPLKGVRTVLDAGTDQ